MSRYKTIIDLDRILDINFTEKLKLSIKSHMQDSIDFSYNGIIRHAMISSDVDKYFQDVEFSWKSIDRATYNTMIDCVGELGAEKLVNYVEQYKIVIN
jgi:hypothetical protein